MHNMHNFDLQLFAGDMNTQTTGGLSAEMKTYYGMELLEERMGAKAEGPMGVLKAMPEGFSNTTNEWYDNVNFGTLSTSLVTVLKDGTLRFPAGCTGIFSVFCMGKDAEGVTIRGGKYDAEHVTLSAGFPLGVSNHFEGVDVTVSVEKGSLLVLWDTANGFPGR